MKTDDGRYRQELCPPPVGCNHHHLVPFVVCWRVEERKEVKWNGVESAKKNGFKAAEQNECRTWLLCRLQFSHIGVGV